MAKLTYCDVIEFAFWCCAIAAVYIAFVASLVLFGFAIGAVLQ